EHHERASEELLGLSIVSAAPGVPVDARARTVSAPQRIHVVSSGIFVTDVASFPGAMGGDERVLPVVRGHQPDLYDKIVGAGLLVFLLFFFMSATLQRYGVPARMEDVV